MEDMENGLSTCASCLTKLQPNPTFLSNLFVHRFLDKCQEPETFSALYRPNVYYVCDPYPQESIGLDSNFRCTAHRGDISVAWALGCVVNHSGGPEFTREMEEVDVGWRDVFKCTYLDNEEFLGMMWVMRRKQLEGFKGKVTVVGSEGKSAEEQGGHAFLGLMEAWKEELLHRWQVVIPRDLTPLRPSPRPNRVYFILLPNLCPFPLACLESLLHTLTHPKEPISNIPLFIYDLAKFHPIRVPRLHLVLKLLICWLTLESELNSIEHSYTLLLTSRRNHILRKMRTIYSNLLFLGTWDPSLIDDIQMRGFNDLRSDIRRDVRQYRLLNMEAMVVKMATWKMRSALRGAAFTFASMVEGPGRLSLTLVQWLLNMKGPMIAFVGGSVYRDCGNED
ncbi:hypothetical protein EX30DRAFT_373844 [Ascodesmis nigricans]|uniref:Uncharacterized protein n=1 Tax=Ascodesmis nigricans TaxID=341454 RepID=A0A4S2MMX4_9PEZI|nr:hypothetical protein EX30DRAFT_373844 [Ascodesmis nigricans]